MKLRWKFWQKAFVCVIVCFILAFDLAAYLIVERSYSMSRANETVAADNEAYIIKKSVSERLLSVAQYYTGLNAENIQQYLEPYGQYYAKQNVYLAIYENDTPVYTSFPGGFLSRPDFSFAPGEKYIQFYGIDNRQYLVHASYLDIPAPGFIFAYIKDEESLAAYRRDIAGYAVKTGLAVSAGLSIILIFLLLGLTSPLRALNKAAKEIARGDYQKRIAIKSRDEIGEFSESFNDMAANIEAHIKTLLRLTEEKQRFIDNLAHEMRTPVAAILGYGELLQNAGLGEQDRLRATDYIISQSMRLQNLTAKLLQISSMKNDVIKMEPLRLSAVVQRAQNTLHEIYKAKNFELAIDLQADDIVGDPDLLESLFQNLLENALRVLDENGKISVRSVYEGGNVCVTVVDNGPGIPQMELPKIFEPFYRIDKARTRAHGGAGLGLSICQQICNIHGAELAISSNPETGTEIKICFTT